MCARNACVHSIVHGLSVAHISFVNVVQRSEACSWSLHSVSPRNMAAMEPIVVDGHRVVAKWLSGGFACEVVAKPNHTFVEVSTMISNELGQSVGIASFPNTTINHLVRQQRNAVDVEVMVAKLRHAARPATPPEITEHVNRGAVEIMRCQFGPGDGGHLHLCPIVQPGQQTIWGASTAKELGQSATCGGCGRELTVRIMNHNVDVDSDSDNNGDDVEP